MPAYIGVHRDIIKLGLHQDAQTMNVLIHLLAMSAEEDGVQNGVRVKVGQIAVTKGELAEVVGLTYKQLRTSLAKLEQEGIVSVATNHHSTVISLRQSGLFAIKKQKGDSAKKAPAEPAVEKPQREPLAVTKQLVFEGIPEPEEPAKDIEEPKKKKGRNKHDYTPEFEAFWKAYPNGNSKQNAFAAWRRLDPSPELQEELIQNVVYRREKGDWKGRDVHLIPHAATYLNGRRWEDKDIHARADKNAVVENPFARMLGEMGGETDERKGNLADTGDHTGALPELW